MNRRAFATLDRAAGESDRSQWVQIGVLADGRNMYRTSEWAGGQRWDMAITEKGGEVVCVNAVTVD